MIADSSREGKDFIEAVDMTVSTDKVQFLHGRDTIRLAKPDKYSFCGAVDGAHQLDLLAFLNVVSLIDAYGVDPEGSR
jgi:hypothetical protein